MTRYLLFLALMATGCSSPSKVQSNKESQAALRSAIDKKTYTFHAQTVQPASGRSRQLTSTYSVVINKDSLSSDLPYFGRAYTAPLNETRSVLQFNSTNFNYEVSPGRKGGWNINIRFNDVKEVQTYSLSVSQDGYASLQVIPTNRQTISFNGTVDGK